LEECRPGKGQQAVPQACLKKGALVPGTRGTPQYLLLGNQVKTGPGGAGLQARLAKKSFLFGHLFFNITNAFAPKNGWGMLVYA